MKIWICFDCHRKNEAHLEKCKACGKTRPNTINNNAEKERFAQPHEKKLSEEKLFQRPEATGK